MTRSYEPREARYLAEWLAKKQLGGEVRLRQKLGRNAQGNAAVSAKYADALVLLRDRNILIEAKFDKVSAGVGQLLVYADLLKNTPGLEHRAELRTDLVLVTPVEDQDVIVAAQKLGVNVIVWKPTPLLDELVPGSSLE